MTRFLFSEYGRIPGAEHRGPGYRSNLLAAPKGFPLYPLRSLTVMQCVNA
jgi:hypothetical protein